MIDADATLEQTGGYASAAVDATQWTGQLADQPGGQPTGLLLMGQLAVAGAQFFVVLGVLSRSKRLAVDPIWGPFYNCKAFATGVWEWNPPGQYKGLPVH